VLLVLVQFHGLEQVLLYYRYQQKIPYHIRVGGRTITVNSTGNCWNLSGKLPHVEIKENGTALAGGPFNLPVGAF